MDCGFERHFVAWRNYFVFPGKVVAECWVQDHQLIHTLEFKEDIPAAAIPNKAS
jgi:hypothetical protein